MIALSSYGLKGSLLLAEILRSRNTTNLFVAINNSSYKEINLNHIDMKKC